METTKPPHDYSSSVDTSRPFTSVKEAVAIFGQRILVGEFYSQNPYNNNYTNNNSTPSHQGQLSNSHSWKSTSSPVINESLSLIDTLKKLETELEETKTELKLLKERESETEVALASLNAELHKNMSKLAEAEAAAAAKKAAEVTRRDVIKEEIMSKEEERKKEMLIRMENSPTLAQILSLGDKGYNKKERKVMKKKPIVPLVSDFFFKKKVDSSNDKIDNPLYVSPNGLF